MASILNESSSKLIPDYFPPSPIVANVNNGETPENEEKARLSTSSVFLTPENSPVDVKKKTELNGDVHTTADCKVSLTEKLEAIATEVQKEVPRPKSRRRRGRKKKQPAKAELQPVKTEEKPVKSEPNDTTVTSDVVKHKAPRKKKTEDAGFKNMLVTDYFPVRRSDRRTKTDLEKEKLEDLEKKILSECTDGLKVVDIENKGRGVVADKTFSRGDFVVEYSGELISMPEANDRETNYAKDLSKGCYMYYFNFKNKKYCIDATAESGKLGRLLNHSKIKGNCHTKPLEVKGHPFLILVASRDISKGEELLYDYGDRDKATLEAHPWLKT